MNNDTTTSSNAHFIFTNAQIVINYTLKYALDTIILKIKLSQSNILTNHITENQANQISDQKMPGSHVDRQ